MSQALDDGDPEIPPPPIALSEPHPVPILEWVGLLALVLAILASPFLFDLAVLLGIAH